MHFISFPFYFVPYTFSLLPIFFLNSFPPVNSSYFFFPLNISLLSSFSSIFCSMYFSLLSYPTISYNLTLFLYFISFSSLYYCSMYYPLHHLISLLLRYLFLPLNLWFFFFLCVQITSYSNLSSFFFLPYALLLLHLSSYLQDSKIGDPSPPSFLS